MSMIAYDSFLRELRERCKTVMTADALEQAIRIAGETLAGYDIEQIRQEERTDKDVLLEAFLDAKRVEGLSEKTLERYRYIICRMLEHFETQSINVTTYHIRKYLADEKGRGISDGTLRGVRSVLSTYFGWLAREGLIQRSPVGNIGAIKKPKIIRKAYTEVDLAKLRSSCRTAKQRAILSFLDASGCRISEVIGLDRQGVDFNQMRCTVLGKGSKERVIYIDDVAVDALQEYLAERTDDNPALFVNREGERIHAGGIRAMLKRLGEDAGVKNVHPHRFRRTRATKMIKRGMPIHEVAAMLGHDKIETTMLYLELDQRNVENSYHRYA